jgi:hypothetical protein|tara:strand:+ start:384 stop:587 length:204 start_codon:yes stop_codon:yes gene_type:complete
MIISNSYIPINYDKVVPEWPNAKTERIEETKKHTEIKVDKIKNETTYTYHPVNKPHRQGEVVDFIIA